MPRKMVRKPQAKPRKTLRKATKRRSLRSLPRRSEQRSSSKLRRDELGKIENKSFVVIRASVVLKLY